ncbi:TolC family protein [Aureivirga sp. CE67]|uniref:TolC family protein n=1 Tax=Aureivirga sp. CE67 TaxID=1788983 RepID=UPI0018CAA2FF|nr:TolC family protein [Aureivirga sp. CE67]
MNSKKVKYPLLFCLFLLFSFLGKAQTLDEYIQIAVDNNYGLQSESLEIENFENKKEQVRSLKDTKIDFGYFVSEPETRVGSQRAKVGVGQEFPWFGTFKAREEIVNSQKEEKKILQNLSKKELISQVQLSYYNLYKIQSEIETYKEYIQNISLYEELSLKAVETNNMKLTDVYKIQIKKEDFLNMLAKKEQLLVLEKRIFNKLLQRNQQDTIVIPTKIEFKNRIFNGKLLEENNPIILNIEQQKQTASKNEFLTTKENKPKIQIGMDYIFVDEIKGMQITDNGKDVFMPKVSLTIPILSKNYKAKKQQYQVTQDALDLKKKEQLKALEIAYRKAETAYQNAYLDMQTELKKISKMKEIIEVSLTSLSTGDVDYLDILSLEEENLKYELKYTEKEYEFFKNEVILQFLTEK